MKTQADLSAGDKRVKKIVFKNYLQNESLTLLILRFVASWDQLRRLAQTYVQWTLSCIRHLLHSVLFWLLRVYEWRWVVAFFFIHFMFILSFSLRAAYSFLSCLVLLVRFYFFSFSCAYSFRCLTLFVLCLLTWFCSMSFLSSFSLGFFHPSPFSLFALFFTDTQRYTAYTHTKGPSLK